MSPTQSSSRSSRAEVPLHQVGSRRGLGIPLRGLEAFAAGDTLEPACRMSRAMRFLPTLMPWALKLVLDAGRPVALLGRLVGPPDLGERPLVG